MDYKTKRIMIKSLLEQINTSPFLDRTIRLFAPTQAAADEFHLDFLGVTLIVAPWRFK